MSIPITLRRPGEPFPSAAVPALLPQEQVRREPVPYLMRDNWKDAI